MARIVVLGCGPSGLLAAAAFDAAGHKTTVVSRKAPSVISGAQFMHEKVELPFHYGYVPGGGEPIRFEYNGTAEGYAQKVYGDMRMAQRVSFGTYEQLRHQAWQLSSLYMSLWRVWEPVIIDQAFISARDIYENQQHFDFCVSTIPLPAICQNKAHSFEAQDIWIVEGIPVTQPPMSITYDGTTAHGWYRASNLWGHVSAEYASPVPHDAHHMKKPYEHNCDCWTGAETVKLLGRYGRWQKGILLDHVWRQSRKLARMWS